MKLYIVRHGETDWNTKRMMQGRSDIPLNDKGREEARLCRDNLKDMHFDRIYASPLKRAYETAEIIKGDRNQEIIKDDRLLEICFGDLEGKEIAELRKSNLAEVLNIFFEKPDEYVPAGDGETIAQACERTESFLKDLREKEASDAEILIVAHGALIKALQMKPLHRNVRDFWGGGVQKNCSVVVLEEMDGQYKLLQDAEAMR